MLLKNFLQGLEEGKDVWAKYRVPVKGNVENFNTTNHYTFISNRLITNTDLDQFYPLYSTVDQELIAGIYTEGDMVVAKFMEILEECSTTLKNETKNAQQSSNQIKVLTYDIQAGLQTLYTSLELDEMKEVRAALRPAFGGFSLKGYNQLYKFFYERSAEWLSEKAARAGVEG